MKSPMKSKTIRTALAFMVTSIVTIIMHYTGGLMVAPPALGAAWSAVLTSAFMIALRFATVEPLAKKEMSSKEENPK
tara:strand:- start:877 stop:1107 length:231 start_codon:yes stop_codon:yes gene_type:complete